jgi:uncharacterized protein (TIRG00374 family)
MKQKQKQETMFSFRRQALNIGVIVAILVLTFTVLFYSLYDKDNPIDFSYFLHMEWGWLLFGIVFLMLSVLCEARSLGLILRAIGHRRSLKDCTVYASSDIYFSAITPSASGGQPAAAFYMTKSGIPISQSSAVLVLNVSIYTVGLLVVSAIAFIARPEYYMSFNTTTKVCVWLGIGFHGLLILACLLFMFSRKIVLLLGKLVIALLCKLRIFKDKEERLETFRASLETYRSCLSIVRKDPKLLLRLLFYSVAQRLLLMPITYLVFRAMGVEASFLDVVIMQIYCTVGASSIPLPGAVGISESLHMMVFTPFIADNNLRMFSMVLTRSVSSYLSILLCGCITMTHHMRHIVRRPRPVPIPVPDMMPEPEQTVDGQGEPDVTESVLK